MSFVDERIKNMMVPQWINRLNAKAFDYYMLCHFDKHFCVFDCLAINELPYMNKPVSYIGKSFESVLTFFLYLSS